MIYNKTMGCFQSTFGLGVPSSKWRQISSGDHSIKACIGKTSDPDDLVTYEQALRMGAKYKVQRHIETAPSSPVSRDLPFWGFWEYIVTTELNLGIHVADGSLVRHEIVDYWLANNLLWEEFLLSQHSKREWGLKGSSGPYLSKDEQMNRYLIQWNSNDKNPNGPPSKGMSKRHKFLKLYFKLDSVEKLLQHPDTKSREWDKD